VFYIFGLAPLLTAGRMLEPEDKRHGDAQETLVLRLTRALVPTTSLYDGDKLFTVVAGQRRMTPMVLVILTLGLTATAFSLLGLRQLFFLVEGLLERLLYLSYGLAAILAFIGMKLVGHSLARKWGDWYKCTALNSAATDCR
jgi:tellurite resistance protein TerC